MHYLDLTKIAVKRGFRGKRTNMTAPISNIASSFRRMMAQDKKVFVPEGRGTFRLTEEFWQTHQ